MAKAILLCGKICSGKTTYAQTLKREHPALILCVDEITLALGDAIRGDQFDAAVERVKTYLMLKSLEILDLGLDVILDWGFWPRAERESVRAFYAAHHIPSELHYLCADDSARRRNIAARNAEAHQKDTESYFVDDGLLKKCDSLFEAPDERETDLRIVNGARQS